jgi:cytochrome c553
MKTVLKTLAALALLGLLAAGAVVGLGLYNVSAQVGHWPGVSWVLHATFRNSAALRAPAPEAVPPLEDPALIALGAGHYASACTPCHAAPGQQASATMRAMVPAPPHIERAVPHWQPNEMHWIVENGIKMSGMPAWPAAGRDDEVWAVVAYLDALRAGQAPPLPEAPPARTGEAAVAYCATCHTRIGGKVPRLDIQDPAYLEAQLERYLSGGRPSGVMAQAASVVAPEEFAALAAYFAETPDTAARADRGPPDPEGAELAARGTRDVPACLACHGAEAVAARKGPALRGQHAAFTATQLRLWRDGVLDHDRLMAAAAQDLTDAQIEALARYFAAAE